MIRMLPSLFARGYIRNSTKVPHLPWISQLLLSLWTWHGARNTMPGSLWPTGDHCGSHCWPTRMEKSLILWGFPRANVGKRLSALLCLLKPGRDERGACRALAAGWWDHEDRLHFSSFSLKINPAKLVQNICRDHLHEAHWFLATRSHTHIRPPCNSPVHLAWRCLPPVTPSRWSQQINSAKIAGKSDARDIQSDRFPHAHWFWCLPICPIWSKSWYQKPNSIQVVSGNWSCLKVGCLIIILPIHFQAKPIELGDSL